MSSAWLLSVALPLLFSLCISLTHTRSCGVFADMPHSAPCGSLNCSFVQGGPTSCQGQTASHIPSTARDGMHGVLAYVSTSSFHSARRLCAAAANSRSHVDPPCALGGAVACSAAPKASLPAQRIAHVILGMQRQSCFDHQCRQYLACSHRRCMNHEALRGWGN